MPDNFFPAATTFQMRDALFSAASTQTPDIFLPFV